MQIIPRVVVSTLVNQS